MAHLGSASQCKSGNNAIYFRRLHTGTAQNSTRPTSTLLCQLHFFVYFGNQLDGIVDSFVGCPHASTHEIICPGPPAHPPPSKTVRERTQLICAYYDYDVQFQQLRSSKAIS
ncbi:hypothetical protein PILCRDRAFT_222404 [Piloderma croceum F 1598]|uniref:Uncharacterized protein n=1 Tax=Piloderma croceum (strain F 1598) TaxID=765440 RepID=A0A0C3CHW3_PILCF|nr:hypothetical protein PILCRDRAFT_222404 [Piloderma croceum F 1598]